MVVYGLWHGGASYSAPENGDLETFVSIGAARDEFATRFHSGRFNRFTYADGRSNTLDTPAVDETSEMWVFLADPRESGDGDWYPDRQITVGPRGGIRIGRC